MGPKRPLVSLSCYAPLFTVIVKHFKLYFKFRKGHVIYVKIPVEVKNNSAGSMHMHILFKDRIMGRPEGVFALGLIGTGIAIFQQHGGSIGKDDSRG